MILLDTGDYTIRMRNDLPVSVPAFISESPDGHLNIYINARLSQNKQIEGLFHEIEHHNRDDLHNGLDIRTIERANHATRPRTLPPLFRASQLLMNAHEEPEIQYKRKIRFDASHEPKPPRHKPVEQPRPISHPLTPHQFNVIMRAIHELDQCYSKSDSQLENKMILDDDL